MHIIIFHFKFDYFIRKDKLLMVDHKMEHKSGTKNFYCE